MSLPICVSISIGNPPIIKQHFILLPFIILHLSCCLLTYCLLTCYLILCCFLPFTMLPFDMLPFIIPHFGMVSFISANFKHNFQISPLCSVGGAELVTTTSIEDDGLKYCTITKSNDDDPLFIEDPYCGVIWR